MNSILKISLVTFFLILLQVKSFTGNNYPDFTIKAQDPEKEKLMAMLSSAKNSGDKGKITDVQKQLDKICGSVTKPVENNSGNFVLVNQPLGNNDVNIVELSQLSGIRAMATAVEQRGQNTGRIWVAAAISNSTARDTIYYFRSDDGGVSWVLYGYLFLNNSDQVNYDQLDIEIIEDNSGDKYIWLVYGLRAANGKEYIGATTLKTPTLMVNEFALTWPGENLSNTNFGHFRPHITSDNAKYSNTASVFISVSYDTTGGSSHTGFWVFAKCVDPYTTTPSITYLPRWGGLLLASPNPTDYHGDIAYMHNGADSIIFVGSNTLNPSFIGVYTINTNFEINGNSIASFNSNNFNKQYGRIACSGGTNQKTVMIVYRENYQNTGDWDLKAQKTTNGGQSWNEINVDTRRDNAVIPYPPDIIAVRNRDGRFALSYTIAGLSNFDTVKYIFTDGVQPGLAYRTVNHLSGFERPKAGFRLVNGDSCFTVWSQIGSGSGNNIWTAGGCSNQQTIGIEHNGSEVPSAFKLEQNYPNPFNPTTNIKFSIPKTGFVKLVIYDITGREVETLIDENLTAGTYKTDFDASALSSGVYFYKLIVENFSDVKKMLMVK